MMKKTYLHPEWESLSLEVKSAMLEVSGIIDPVGWGDDVDPSTGLGE